MCENTSKQSENLLFPELFSLTPVCGKQVEASFTVPDLSSECGLLLLAEFERCSSFIGWLDCCIQDAPNHFLVCYTYKEMLTQRILQIASGYEDADDCNLLRDDSVLKLCAGKSPDSSPLSSQPTMSRLENRMSTSELYNMEVCFVEEFINSYGEEPECIILDCDDAISTRTATNRARFSTIITTNTATCHFSSSRGFRGRWYSRCCVPAVGITVKYFQ